MIAKECPVATAVARAPRMSLGLWGTRRRVRPWERSGVGRTRVYEGEWHSSSAHD